MTMNASSETPLSILLSTSTSAKCLTSSDPESKRSRISYHFLTDKLASSNGESEHLHISSQK